MAGIPISEIPNAPRLNGPALIDRGGPRTTDINSTTRSLLTRPMSDAGAVAQGQAYQNLGAGLANLGESGLRAAAALNHWQEIKAESEDVIAINKREMARADYQARQTDEMARIPLAERPAYFLKKIPELRKTIEAIPVSSRRAESEQTAQIRWEKQNYGAIYLQSNKQTLEQGKEIGLENYRRKLAAGDFESALSGLTEMKSALLLSDQQYEAEKAGGELYVDQLRTREYLAQNPRGLLDDVNESLQAGKPLHGFQWSREDMHRLRQEAQTAIVHREVETSRTAHQAVLSGKLTNETTLRQQAGPDLPGERITSLARLTWQDPDYNPAALTKLRTAVRAFQPGSDRDKAKYDALQSQVESTVPKAIQPALADELYAAWQSRGQADHPASALRDQQARHFAKVDAILKTGLLGDRKDESTFIKAEFMKAQVERYMKTNPQAGSKDVRTYIQELADNGGLIRTGASLFQQRLQPRR